MVEHCGEGVNAPLPQKSNSLCLFVPPSMANLGVGYLFWRIKLTPALITRNGTELKGQEQKHLRCICQHG